MIDFESIIVKRVINDAYWFLPSYFKNDHLGSLKIKDPLNEIKKHDTAIVPQIALSPPDLVIWAHKMLPDHKKYLHALGIIAYASYAFLSPIDLYAISGEDLDDRIEEMKARFVIDLYRGIDLVGAMKENFDDFTLAHLSNRCMNYQGQMMNEGRELVEWYKRSSTAILNLECLIKFYSAVVNLTYYCWMMTVNDELRTIDYDRMRFDQAFRLNWMQSKTEGRILGWVSQKILSKLSKSKSSPKLSANDSKEA